MKNDFNFSKDWASEAFGIVLLEYHNKNHLEGDDNSRNEAVSELMDSIMKLEVSEEIKDHAKNVKNWVLTDVSFFRDPKTQCEMVQNELLSIIGCDTKTLLFKRNIPTEEITILN